jgi:hypothetical protein
MPELKTVPGFVTGTPRPEWDYTNDLKVPTSLHLEPSFKEELGLVFLRLKRGDAELGIWLDGPRVDSLRAGLEQIATYAEDGGRDE